MGKNKTIDHRQPPRSAGIPMVLRGGTKVAAHPEPEVATDEVVQLRRQAVEQRGRIEELERRLRVKTAEVQGFKQSLQDARDEAHELRRQQQQPDLEGQMPTRIEIVTVDDIARHDDVATMKVLADVGGVVGETQLSLSVQQLKLIIKRKQQEQHHEQRTE